MGNIIKSMNLDLILEGTGVKPTIPTNPRAVFGNPDFDQTSDLMIGQKAYNVTDDIWYYRGKSGIHEIPTNKTYVIDIYPYINIGGLLINKPGDYYIWSSQNPEGAQVGIGILLHAGQKVVITNMSSILSAISTTDGVLLVPQPNYTYNYIAIKKEVWPNPLPPDIPTEYDITTLQGSMQLPVIGGD
ncbi:hypothetical protein M0Q97_12795 [Candidatus Dojkabacteria bacterium]|jgi:hypothetical protein|nr:hypothetical protein [Candidatus Dojkabacteria bacterium]